jgi:tetratricopeptide (TPR) repeat protein
MVGANRVGPHHDPLLNIESGRRAFSRSEFIERHWPPRLRDQTSAWFRIRRYAHQLFFGNQGEFLQRIPRLHQLLTETPLETHALWLLGTTTRRVECSRLAREAGNAEPEVDMALAADAMANRRFEEAAESYRNARLGRSDSRPALYLEIFALEMAGRHEAAGELATTQLRTKPSPDEAQYLAFLERTFGRVETALPNAQ